MAGMSVAATAPAAALRAVGPSGRLRRRRIPGGRGTGGQREDRREQRESKPHLYRTHVDLHRAVVAQTPRAVRLFQGRPPHASVARGAWFRMATSATPPIVFPSTVGTRNFIT